MITTAKNTNELIADLKQQKDFAHSLNPKGWTSTAVISDTATADSSVKLVGVLTGDVDGSWTGV